MADQRRVYQRLMGPLWRRLRLLVSRGVLRLVDDSLKLQSVQITMLGDQPASAERFQQYGMTSHPHPGAEAIIAAVGGARAHLVALAVDDRRYRVKGLKRGEVCMYTDEGDEIRLKRGRVIGVTAGAQLDVSAPVVTVKASTSVTYDTPIFTVTGDIKSNGQITDATSSMQAMRDTFNGHDHDENDNSGPTDSPNQEMS